MTKEFPAAPPEPADPALETHRTVRREIEAWLGTRTVSASATLHFTHEREGTKVLIWTTEGEEPEHLVIEMKNFLFSAWEVRAGDFAQLLGAIMQARRNPQWSMRLPGARTARLGSA